jgi:hypothetical protein
MRRKNLTPPSILNKGDDEQKMISEFQIQIKTKFHNQTTLKHFILTNHSKDLETLMVEFMGRNALTGA